MPSLTLEDIARETGVSRSTVSRVINNSPNVRDDVRRKVQEAIQRNQYHPHAAARALASQHTSTIGLILPQTVSFFFTDPFYPHLTKGIAQACNQHDYTLAFFLVGSTEDEERIFPRVCRPGNAGWDRGAIRSARGPGNHRPVGGCRHAICRTGETFPTR